MLRGGFRLAGPLVVGLLVSGLAACTGRPPSEVDVGAVDRATVTEVVEAPANVVARAAASVPAPATGTVAALDVADGATVAAGQVLLRIDGPAAEQALARAEDADAQVASAGGRAGTPR